MNADDKSQAMVEEYFVGLEAPAHVVNTDVVDGQPCPDTVTDVLGASLMDAAIDEIRQWPDYAPTPLHRLDGLAAALGVHRIHYKDEGQRFGLGSFKALGGAYEVLCLLQALLSEKLARPVSMSDIRSGSLAEQAAGITVVTATDGNHGRSVAWGAQQFGCDCRIYLHTDVSAGRQRAIEACGATVVRTDGNYDDSVRRAADDASTNGWHIVSDTSYEGYLELPRFVMAGYAVMSEEVLQQIGRAPTHVFIQGGCGGLAAGVAAHQWLRCGATRPRMVIVEPRQAACLFESARAGQATDVSITEESIMAGLSCGEVSLLGWQILTPAAHDFLRIDDAWIGPAMRLLADGVAGDIPVVGGESGVAGLAALAAVCQDDGLRESLCLGADARVLLLGTEGATDAIIYSQLVGRSPLEVVASALS